MLTQKRIPFGREQHETTAHSNCPSCQVTFGKLHKPGCPEELCPECRECIIACDCNCLSSLDSTLIIQALYLKFTDINSALLATKSTNTGSKGHSYLIHAAMQYLFEQLDEKSRDEISRKMHLSFPLLKPAMHDENGTGYYTSEQLAKVFDVTVEEINNRIEALSAAGFVIKSKEQEDLKKSN